MDEVVRNVTIFLGTKKRLAKRFRIEEFEQRGRGKVTLIHFMEKGARSRWWRAEAPSIVILDGWDHPEFEWLIRELEKAPIQQLSQGVTYKTVGKTYGPGEPTKDKYELEFEAYIGTLQPAKILMNTRQSG
jgi:hypothetical protein